VSVGDEAGREAEERLVYVIASLPADAQAPEAVQPGDGALDHPTEDAQARAVLDTSFGDDRSNVALPQQATVLVVVVAAVGEECVGPASGPADDTGHGRNLVDQGQQLRDVVAVTPGQ